MMAETTTVGLPGLDTTPPNLAPHADTVQATAWASVVEMQQARRWQSPTMPGQYARKQIARRGGPAAL